ncbi:MAG: excinuclease ABC subunit UvrA, partial [Flavobacteriaceae bacterium]|nr:excinuclease ABC subunit UvrA [Flavobacteriaceae bacterium]
PELKKTHKHHISVVIDRLSIPAEITEEFQSRLADSIETALRLTDGLVDVQNHTTQDVLTLSSKFSCPVSGFTLPEIEPRLFSFNSPLGACPVCSGLGKESIFSKERVVPDSTLSLAQGAIAPWFNEKKTGRFDNDTASYYTQILESVTQHFDASMNTPFANLPDTVQHGILYGTDTPILFQQSSAFRTKKILKLFEGVIPSLERRYKSTESDWVRDYLSHYQEEHVCSACDGKRLNAMPLSVKINGLTIADVCAMSIGQAQIWFSNLNLSEKNTSIAERILREIHARLKFLVDVGLDYLSFSRTAGTLSGGESQRIRLASQIGSGLTGVLYVLDEPSIGLHQRDNDRLLKTIEYLRDLGNTVIVVEHDEDAIRAADYLVDMGPGAGRNGGYIVSQGTPSEVMLDKKSITGQYLRGEKCIALPKEYRKGNGKKIAIKGATLNNLQNVSVDFPLGKFVCVTGVSGGGKSSLVIETLYKAVSKELNNSKDNPGPYKSLTGLEHIDKIIDIDQTPIGRTPRSNPATYVGCFTPIREWFATLPDAKAKGYAAGRFSFNVKGGRCEACSGDGVVKIEMHFLPDVYVQCDQCHGKRYNRETLSVRYRDKTISDILDMTVDEAMDFFHAQTNIREKLKTLQEVGLGYIHVGQQATTLSGGEAQRIKLAKELSRRSTGKTLYILDEPTTGLHFEDIRKLLEVLHRIVDQGNTVIVI